MSVPSGDAVVTPYELVVRGELSDEGAAELGARSVEARRGKTLIVVDVIDQSHLHGVFDGSRAATSSSSESIRSDERCVRRGRGQLADVDAYCDSAVIGAPECGEVT